jgi:hypothetical protein
MTCPFLGGGQGLARRKNQPREGRRIVLLQQWPVKRTDVEVGDNGNINQWLAAFGGG